MQKRTFLRLNVTVKKCINEETPCQIKSAEQLNGLMNLKGSDLLSKSLALMCLHISAQFRARKQIVADFQGF